MTQEVRLWIVGGDDVLTEVPRGALDLENRLERWIERDVSLLSPDLLVFGRQVQTDHGGVIDLLCLDPEGNVVIVELKRGRTPREVTAQVLDYAAWAQDLSSDRILQIASEQLGGAKAFEQAFHTAFGVELPEVLNESHRMLVVASQLDPATERIIEYLSDVHGVEINAATFQFFKGRDGREVLSRVFLIEPEEVEYKARTRASSKRRRALTYEELEQMARSAGVEALFEQIDQGMSSVFSKGTSRSSLRYQGEYKGGSRRVLFSLFPGDSSREEGLKFQVYSHRLARVLETTEEQVRARLPESGAPWSFSTSTAHTENIDWCGFEGFFKTPAEVDSLLSLVAARTTQEPRA